MGKPVRLLLLSLSFLSVLLAFQNCGEVKFKKRGGDSTQTLENASTGAAISLVSQTVFEAQSVQLESIISQSASNPAFIWLKDGAVLPGQGDTSLSIAAAQLSDQGLYEVIYMDGSEELGRAQAQLTVIQQFFAPEISTHPSDKVATVKTQVVFSVEASGSNLSYQWLKNGSEISGANLSSLTIASAETSDAGDYSVRVSNSAGELESQSANLTVELRKVVVDCVHNYSYAYCKKPDGSCFTTYCGPGWDNATCGIAPQYGVPQSQVKKIASQKYKRSMCGSPSKSYQAQYEVSF